jgi:hypothetical protein
MQKKALLLLVMGCSCAQPPRKEVDMASIRVARAHHEGASEYAGELQAEAEEALARAREALSNPRRYREAAQAAALASMKADEARLVAGRENERMARQTHRCFRECEVLIEEARSLGLSEPVSFTQRLSAVEDLLENGQVMEAYDTAETLKQELLSELKKLKTKRD